MELTYRAEPRIEGSVLMIEEFIGDPTDCFDPIRSARERFQGQIVDTRDAILREALIKLGWTPPPEPRSRHDADINETRLRVRADDPCTSIEAAERAAKFAGSHQDRILRALGDLELSTHQVATRCGLTVVQVDRRICELEREGRIEVVTIKDAPLERLGYQVYRRIRSRKN